MTMKALPVILVGFFIFLFPLNTLAQTDSIPLQKDVFLGYPIITAEDLPNQISINLYDSKEAQPELV